MRQFFTADMETEPFRFGRCPEPFITGLYTEGDYRDFQNFDDFIDFIKTKNIIIFVHNGGKFDYKLPNTFCKYVEQLSPIKIISGRLSSFKIGKAEFRDSMNIFPGGLGSYKKDNFEYWKMEKEHRNQYMDEIRKYLKNDCVYLYEFIKAFKENYSLKMTLAGSALSQWEKISGFKRPSSSLGFFKTFKPFYFGGRVQNFFQGIIKKDFQYIDVNSAYPYAMTFKHPFSTCGIGLSKLPKNYEQCLITLQAKSRGVFPFIADKTFPSKDLNRLVFPDDNIKRTFNITGWEFRLAEKFNLLKECKILHVWDFSSKIDFRNYVSHFFKLKKEGRETGDFLKEIQAKYHLNALYGKFGINYTKFYDYQFLHPAYQVPAMKDGWKPYGFFGNYALVRKPLDQNRYHFLNVATAASITGFERAFLTEEILKSDTPLNCDTDSLACLKHKAKLGNELGEWKLEGIFSEGAFVGKKLYAMKNKKTGKWKNASKGVKLSEKEIYKLAKGQKITYYQDAPSFSFIKKDFKISRTLKMIKN